MNNMRKMRFTPLAKEVCKNSYANATILFNKKLVIFTIK